MACITDPRECASWAREWRQQPNQTQARRMLTQGLSFLENPAILARPASNTTAEKMRECAAIVRAELAKIEPEAR